mmetsp:Transcript_10060/g.34764  ORF Transcript_10060/g.34764 Transcript_10060/m.34764 type:complete len:306 (-) Transcript_10060:556-1473(-)
MAEHRIRGHPSQNVPPSWPRRHVHLRVGSLRQYLVLPPEALAQLHPERELVPVKEELAVHEGLEPRGVDRKSRRGRQQRQAPVHEGLRVVARGCQDEAGELRLGEFLGSLPRRPLRQVLSLRLPSRLIPLLPPGLLFLARPPALVLALAFALVLGPSFPGAALVPIPDLYRYPLSPPVGLQELPESAVGRIRGDVLLKVEELDDVRRRLDLLHPLPPRDTLPRLEDVLRQGLHLGPRVKVRARRVAVAVAAKALEDGAHHEASALLDNEDALPGRHVGEAQKERKGVHPQTPDPLRGLVEVGLAQ